MKDKKEKGVRYYCIRASLVWGVAVIMVLCVGLAFFKDELYDRWLKSGGTVTSSPVELQSELKSKEKCLLCGNNNRSLMGYYRKMDTIGVISLNDWQILDFRLKDYDGEENEIPTNSGTSSFFGNTDEISYMGNSTPSMGMASIDVTLPDNHTVNTEFLQKNLCDECLDKVMDSLEYKKWKNERKEANPLCLVDFQTLEIYSLQDWHTGYWINNYWVEIEYEKNKIDIEVFTLLTRE